MIPAPHASDPAEAPLRVGAHLIRMDYLLPEVRFKGNAYGASFSYDSRSARAAFGSFRDPHVARTLGVFDATDRYVADAEWSQLDIDRAIIATAKGDFRPVRPGQAIGAALQRHLSGTIDELRQRRYESLRRVTPQAVKEAWPTSWSRPSMPRSASYPAARSWSRPTRNLSSRWRFATSCTPAPEIAPHSDLRRRHPKSALECVPSRTTTLPKADHQTSLPQHASLNKELISDGRRVQI